MVLYEIFGGFLQIYISYKRIKLIILVNRLAFLNYYFYLYALLSPWALLETWGHISPALEEG